ncbi:MAG TPA: tRNA uridine-5-carboxymethylaminomethyl(34) synthesis GTPase MnmE [Firmicutes bacterium]|nr:tRNA uridine-5-carboxymethylaminomethyl(34) synthesis GTPase MnmE [Bacillota bacterium]
MFETIVALATPKLKSALAIIRLSGDDCFDVVSKVFSKDLTKNKKRDIHFGYIKDNDKEIDQVVLLTYVSPHSFTGEDSVEIICHGSMLIADQIIKLMLKNGARYATNGEFSSRAFLNGKVDLIQAEAINDMINATTDEAKELSMLALKGENSKLFKPIKDKIGELLAKVEVNIDYPEYEDIEVTSKEQIIKTSKEIIALLDDLIKQGEKDKMYREGLKIAIVGKPNVGKSSLLNALINEDKAIVTSIAGTTRDIVEGDFSLMGVPIHLFDTAGLHESDDVIEQIGIEKAKNSINESDLILFVVDETGIDNNLYNLIFDKKHIIVYNKKDLFNDNDKNKLYISAKEKDIKPLLDKIKETMNIGELTVKPSFNNTRQLGILKNIVFNLSQGIADAENSEPIDLISTSLMVAYNASLELLGESNKNDLVDEIFSRFCVGK